jgi:hypothetical protein
MTSSSSRSSRSGRKSSSVSKKRSILKKNGTRKARKHVRINSPRNETRVYSLGSEEKRWKQGSPSKRGNPCGNGIYPCVYRGVVFENKDEWNEHVENTISRNATTGHIPISSHRRSIMSSLYKKGKTAKRIPKEYRLYDLETGEVHDIRTYNPSKSKSSLNTNM